MFVLRFNSAVGSTLKRVCLRRLIGGGGLWRLASAAPPGCLDDAEVARLPLRLHLPLKSCVTFQM